MVNTFMQVEISDWKLLYGSVLSGSPSEAGRKHASRLFALHSVFIMRRSRQTVKQILSNTGVACEGELMTRVLTRSEIANMKIRGRCCIVIVVVCRIRASDAVTSLCLADEWKGHKLLKGSSQV
jgi:hypothetical protein